MGIRVYSNGSCCSGCEVELVEVVVVADVMKVDLIDKHIRFGTYHRLDFSLILMDNLFKSWAILSKVDLLVISSSTTPTLAEKLSLIHI